MKDILEKLKDDDHYYGEFGKQYLSNSDIITLLNNPKEFRKPKDFTMPMLLGRYFHTAMLEPEKLVSEEFTSIDVTSRNSKKYKEEILGYGRTLMMLDKEKAKIDSAVLVMKYNLEFFEDIYDDANEFEVPVIWVSHDPQQISRLADRAFRIENNEVKEVKV